MLYFIVDRDQRTKGIVFAREVIAGDPSHAPNYETRNDWKTFEDAGLVAAALGDAYLAIDAGANISPRYDVIKRFQVGEKVSYGYNGDSYPCGKITKISASGRRIVATDEQNKQSRVFYRRGLSGVWKSEGTWSLCSGWHYSQNPSF